MKTPAEIAREAIGADALAGIGYEQYLPYAERAARIAQQDFTVKSDVTWPDAQPELADLVDISVARSDIDGAVLVMIDTHQDTGDIRIELNDGVIWDGDPESISSDRHLLSVIAEANAIVQADFTTVAGRAIEFHKRVLKVLEDADVAGRRS